MGFRMHVPRVTLTDRATIQRYCLLRVTWPFLPVTVALLASYRYRCPSCQKRALIAQTLGEAGFSNTARLSLDDVAFLLGGM